MKNIAQIKKGLLIMVFVLSLNTLVAQEKPSREKMEVLKIAYITEKLDLSESESQQFWPIYNSYRKELRSSKESLSKRSNFEEMTDEEINQFINQKIKSEQQMIDLKKRYFEKCKSVLSMQKIAKLISLEKEFRKEILNRMNKQRK